MFEIISICKGGGYRYCRTIPTHPKANSNGLYPLHRVLMENHIGRHLKDDEIVHHIDEDKTNDEINNLALMKRSEHSKHHHPEIELVTLECPICGTIFDLEPHFYRLRFKRNKGKQLGCSRSCGAVIGHMSRM